MASGKKINFGVGSNNPETVILALEGVDSSALVQVPDPDGLVLARRQDKILVRVEQAAAGVLEMASAGIDLPLCCVSEPPSS
jgi:hypothetical protein